MQPFSDRSQIPGLSRTPQTRQTDRGALRRDDTKLNNIGARLNKPPELAIMDTQTTTPVSSDMLRLERIAKIYPHGEALKDVSWEVKSGDRIGLVGANGTGKTTQFKIIMGEIEPTSGEIFKTQGIKIACLPQEFDVVPGNTLSEELLSAFKEVHDIKAALHEVQIQLETASPQEVPPLLHKMDRLTREFEANDGYALELKVDRILPSIGFSASDAPRLVGTFSGGWQMRIALGKLMLQQPDVLLLDEPTNHIDLETIEWLETYLRSQTTPMVIVSHDRHFLDRLCTKIVEIERGVSRAYSGNYTSYAAARKDARAAQLAAWQRQQEEISRQMEFVERFRASATRSTQAKSREKQLDKIELVEAPAQDERTLHFRFPSCRRSGREVVIIKNLTHAYGENILFLGADLLIERGDRIAILGPNGSGKSTLLRLITGTERPLDGTVRLGEHNVIAAYFEQNQAEALDLDTTVLATVREEVPEWKDEEVRGLLGKFLFGGDTVFKRVGTLSGGEKARLALAKMLLKSANLLILDEPTNHLDIPAKETIEEALQAYEGAVIVVSHDRYFISQVANKIVEIKDGQLRVFAGNYQYYLERIEQEKQLAAQKKRAADEAARLAEKRARQKEKELSRSARRSRQTGRQ